MSWLAYWPDNTNVSSLASRLSATSGVVTFNASVSTQSFQIRIINNTVPVPDQTFAVNLTSVVGGGRVDFTANSENVTIPNANNAFGVFVMQNMSATVTSTQGVVYITANRTAGLYNTVTVGWSLQPSSFLSLPLASAVENVDYQFQFGIITFGPQVATQTVAVALLTNNTTPSPDLSFLFVLNPNQVTGGAVLSSQQQLTYTTITIQAHNMASGSFGFDVASLFSNTTAPTSSPQAFTLTIDRFGGLFGSVQVSWQVSGSAHYGTDYATTGGTVKFAQGQTSAEISITLLANNAPSLESSIFVTLTSISGQYAGQYALQQNVSVAVVTLSEHTDPHGVIGFNTSIVATGLAENKPSVGTTTMVSIEVDRLVSAFNSTTVQWSVAGPHLDVSIAPTSGSIIFADGQTTAFISFSLLGNKISEVDQLYTILLQTASQGRIDSNVASLQLTILSSNQPYGIVQLATSAMMVPEPQPGEVFSPFDVVIQRNVGLGAISVKIRSIVASGDPLHVATPNDDFLAFDDTVFFDDGSTATTYTAYVLRDNNPKCDRTFGIQIYAVLDPNGNANPNAVALGALTTSWVTIPIDNMGNGIFSFDSSAYSSLIFSQPSTFPVYLNFPLLRFGGVCGNISVSWSSSSTGAFADISPIFGQVVFPEGSTSGNLSMTLQPLNFATIDRQFTLNLDSIINAEAGQAAFNSSDLSLSFTIVASNPTWIQLSESTYLVDGASGSLNVTVIRGGSLGGWVYANVSASEVPYGYVPVLSRALANLDFVPVNTVITFAPNQSQASVSVPLIANGLPQVARLFNVSLLAPWMLNNPFVPILATPSSAIVFIAPHDAPYGQISIIGAASSAINVGSSTSIDISRQAGSIEAVSVTVTLNGTAQLGSDFLLFNGSVPISTTSFVVNFQANKLSNFTLNVNVPFSSTPSGAKNIIISLSDPTNGAKLGSNNVAVLTIAEHDFPNGVFGFVAPAQTFLPQSATSFTTKMQVARAYGTIGTVSVTWSVSQASLVTPASGSLQFIDGQTIASFTVIITPPSTAFDNTDLVFVLSGSAQISKGSGSATQVLPANNDPYGTVALAGLSWSANADTRSINVQLSRTATFQPILVSYSVTFSPNSSLSCQQASDLPSPAAVTIPAGAASFTAQYVVPFNWTAGFNSTFCVTLFNATLVDGTVYQALSGPSPSLSTTNPATSGTIATPSVAANGIVSLTPNSTSPITVASGAAFTLHLVRSAGYFGNLSVSWSIVSGSQAKLDPTVDFAATSGSVYFAANQITATLLVTSIATSIPSLDSQYVLVFTSVSAPLQQNLLPAAGISVIISQHNFPSGTFSFAQQSIDVLRSQGNAVVTISRVGTFGAASVTVQTISNASTTAIAGVDYTPLNVTINFADGQQAAVVTISLNSLLPNPPSQVVLFLQLSSPSLSTILGTQASTRISIDSCVACLAGFATGQNSPTLLQPPAPNNISLNLTRNVVAFGVFTVYWYISGANAADNFASTSGYVAFQYFDSVTTLVLTQIPNLNPQFATTYTVALVSASGEGGLDPARSSFALILDTHNYPYGLIQFQSSSVNVTRSSTSQTTNLIAINRTGGTLGNVSTQINFGGSPITFFSKYPSALGSGTVIVALSSIASANECAYRCLLQQQLVPACVGFDYSTGSGQSCILRSQSGYTTTSAAFAFYADNGLSRTTAVNGVDFVLNSLPYSVSSTWINFTSGQTTALLNITTLPNALPKGVESIAINMSQILLNGASLSGLSASAIAIGANNISTISIAGVNSPNGVVSFAATTLASSAVSQGQAVSFTLTRARAQFGAITVRFSIWSQNAVAQADYSPSNGTVSFADGQSSATFSVQALPSSVSSFNKTLVISLTSPTGGATLATTALTQTNLTILEHDYPSGLLQLASTSNVTFSIPELGSSSTSLNLTVQRAKGLPTAVNLTWVINFVSGAKTPQSVFAQSSGIVTFAANDNTATIALSIIPSSTPSLQQSFMFSLSGATGGASLLASASSLYLIASAHDSPQGVFGFANTTLHFSPQSNVITVSVIRSFGTIGATQVSYTTVLGTPGGPGAASQYFTPTSGILTFASGVVQQSITIIITSFPPPQPSRYFYLQLSSPTNGAAIGQARVTIVVDQNGGPAEYGSFSFASSITYVAKKSSSTIMIYRSGGLYDSIAVAYSVGTVSSLGNYFQSAVTGVPETTSTLFFSGIPSTEACANQCLVLPFKQCRAVGYVAGTQQCFVYSLPQIITINTTAAFVVQYVARINPANLDATKFAVDGKDFTSVPSAQVIFPANVNKLSIPLPIIDNSAPEFTKSFRVRLLSLTDVSSTPSPGYGPAFGSFIDTQVTILPSSGISGTFDFANVSNFEVIQPNSLLSFEIERSVFTNLDVTLDWSVSGGAAVTNFFAQESGSILFENGQPTGSIQIQTLDDGLPRLETEFQLTITNADALTGAAVIGRNNTISIIFPEAYLPAGLFTLSYNGTGVAELQKGASFNATVSRTFGLLKAVNVTWIIKAVSDLTDPNAFEAFSGTVFLDVGQASADFEVDASVSSRPSIAQLFQLTILDIFTPSGAQINVNSSTIEISIDAHDHPFGIAGFSQQTLVTSAAALVVNTFSIPLYRNYGTLDNSQIAFSLTPLDMYSAEFNQLALLSSAVWFQVGNASIEVTLTVPATSTPTPELHYQLSMIVSIGQAMIDPAASTCNVTVLAHNNPTGVFAIQTPFSLDPEIIGVNPGQDAIIAFQRLDGNFGDVLLNWEVIFSFPPDLLSPYNLTLTDVSTLVSAAPSEVSVLSGSLLFANSGDSQISIALTTILGNAPKLTDYFYVRIINVTLLSSGFTVEPTIESSKSLAAVAVFQANNPFGVLQFNVTALTVPVEAGLLMIPVYRSYGLFGALTAQYTATSVNASATLYQVPLPTQITFVEGQSVAYVPVEIVSNTVPSLAQIFAITLTDSSPVVPIISSASVSTITVAAHNIPYGLIFFSTSNIPIPLLVTIGSNVTLPLVRYFGLFDDQEVNWKVGPPAIAAQMDPSEGTITMYQGEQFAELSFVATDFGVPEIQQEFYVTLTSVVGTSALAPTDTSVSFTLLGNNDPFGAFGVDPSQLNITVSDGNQQIAVAVVRTRGTQGVVRVTCNTFSDPAFGVGHLAQPNVDYSPINQTLTFLDGEIVKFVNVTLFRNAVPSLDQYFVLNISSVALVSQYSPYAGAAVLLDDQSRATFMISAHDDTNGLLSVPVTPIVAVGNQSVVSIPITRAFGTYGAVSVSYETTDISATSVDGPSSLTLSPFSSIPTVQADSSRQFVDVQGKLYMAVASRAQSTQLFTFDASTQSFVLSQTLTKKRCRSVEAFIFNNDTYVVVAIWREDANLGNSYSTNSLIFKLNKISLTFEFYQPIATTGATHCKAFQINGLQYILISQFVDDSGNYSIGSALYVWNPVASLFVLSSMLPTSGAFHVDFASMTTGAFLAVSSYQNGIAQYQTQSSVFVWNTNSSQFNLLQTIDTNSSTSCQFQQIVMDIYLTFGNYKFVDQSAATRYDVPSAVYKWNAALSLFSFFQTLPTTGIYSIAPISLNNEYYLACANMASDETGMVTASQVFHFSALDQEYELVYSFATNGASSVAVFTIGERQFIAATSLVSGVSLNISLIVVPNLVADYEKTVGLATFAPGQAIAFVDVNIIDTSLPVPIRRFAFELLQAQGGALIANSKVTVVLPARNNYLGVFGFDIPTLSQNWTLSVPTGPTSSLIVFNISRTHSVGGMAFITWNITHFVAASLNSSSGTVLFASNQSFASIVLSLLPNTVPAFTQTMSLQLTTVTDGGSINSQQNVVNVTILSHNNPFGGISFSASTVNLTVVKPVQLGASASISFAVVRQADALFIPVGVSFTILPLQVNEQLVSNEDLSLTSGVLSFDASGLLQTKYITVNVSNNGVPKLAQSFQIILAATSPSAVPFSSNGSVAYLNVPESNSPHGIFSVQTVSGLQKSGLSRTIPINITRIGLFGVVKVSLAFSYAANANATFGLNSTILPSPSSALLFIDQVALLTTTLLIPTNARLDYNGIIRVAITNVQLLSSINGTVQSTLPQGSNYFANVVTPFSCASGVIGFVATSLQSTVFLNGTLPSVSLQLSLQRNGGSFGVEAVQWTSTIVTSQFTPATGISVFNDGDSIQNFSLLFTNAGKPALDQTFFLNLSPLNTTSRLTATAARINVPAYNNPFGSVSFANQQAFSFVSNNATSRYLTFTTVRNGGTFGGAFLNYSLFYQAPSQASAVLASSYVVSASGLLVLNAGQSVAVFNFPLQPNTILDYLGQFSATLNSVSLFANQTTSAFSSISISLNTSAALSLSTTVTSDVASFGFVSVSAANSSALFTTSAPTTVPVTLLRTVSSARTVTVGYSITSVSGNLIGLISPMSGVVALAAGATSQTIYFVLTNDGLPSLPGNFSISITTIGGGAQPIGLQTTTVFVGPRNNASGLFGFANVSSQILARPLSVNSITLSFGVVRTGGTSGAVVLPWIISGNVSAADVAPLSGQVAFAEGQTAATIALSLFASSVPQLRSSFSIQLGAPTGGVAGQSQLISSLSIITATILASNDPFGEFSLVSSAILIQSSTDIGRFFSMSVSRSAGTYGSVDVKLIVSALSRAIAADASSVCTFPLSLASPCFNIVTLPAGVAQLNLTLAISDTVVLTLTDWVAVSIASVTLSAGSAPLLSEAAPIVVTALSHLTFQSSYAVSQGALQFITGFTSLQLSVPNVNTPLKFPFARLNGTYVSSGPQTVIAVQWALTTTSGTSISSDIQGPFTGTVFLTGTTLIGYIVLTQMPNIIPSDNKTFSVALIGASACNGASLSNCTAFPAAIAFPSSIPVLIASHNSPTGMFSFASSFAIVDLSILVVNASVVRSQGTSGTVFVSYQVLQGPYDTYVISKSGSLQFGDGQDVAYLSFSVTSSNSQGNFTMQLLSASGTASIGSSSVEYVTIPAIPAPTSSDSTGSFLPSSGPSCIQYVPSACLPLGSFALANMLPSTTVDTCIVELHTLASQKKTLCSGAATSVMNILAALLSRFSSAGYGTNELGTLGAVLDLLLAAPAMPPSFSRIYEQFSSSLLADCKSNVDGTSLCPCCCRRTYANIHFTATAVSALAPLLNGANFSSVASRLILPKSLSVSPAFAEINSTSCVTEQVILYGSSAMFASPKANRQVLQGAVVSSSIKDIAVSNLALDNQVQYEVSYSDTILDVSCVYWDFSAGSWLEDGCSLYSQVGGSVVCQCTHFTNFGVLVLKTDVLPYHFLAGILLVIIACVLFLALFFRGPKGAKLQLEARIINEMIFSILFMHVMLLANMLSSRKMADSASLFALGLLLHLSTLLCCFYLVSTAVCIYLRASSFSINSMKLRAFRLRYFAGGPWLLSICIVALYIAFGQESFASSSHVYGDVYNNGRMFVS